MLISNYELSGEARKCLRRGTTAEVLKEPPLKFPDEVFPAVVVWEKAMFDVVLQEEMRKPDWASRIFKAFAKDMGWNWSAKHSAYGDTVITDPQEIVQLIAKASGENGVPDGNIVAALDIRTYTDKDSPVGNYAWWMEQKNNINAQYPFVNRFLFKLMDMFRQMHEVGIDIHTEKISMVLAKDPNSKLATITPALHSDIYYGVRESVLCSLLEDGFNPYGGTLSLPTVKMTDLRHHGPIYMENLLEIAEAENLPLLKVNSGDVLLHDGMIGPDGKEKLSLGVPHISPDIAGKSSRLVLLMRYRNPTKSSPASEPAG